MSDGSEFHVVSEDKHRVYGYYVGKEHIGVCPLNKECLINHNEIKVDQNIENWREVLYVVDHFTESKSTSITWFMPCVKYLSKYFSIKKISEKKITPKTLFNEK